MFDKDITIAAKDLIDQLRANGATITTAESCTGGLIAAAITSISGASDVFKCGYITYSNDAKTKLVSVDPEMLRQQGAVSREVAAAMAEGALKAADATCAISATGIAGPLSDGTSKPVGLVYIGLAHKLQDGSISTATTELRLGAIGRDAIRRETVLKALMFTTG